jgi:hypothetical protein
VLTLAINLLMNKIVKGIAYMHLVKNNVVPLVLRDYVLACN